MQDCTPLHDAYLPLAPYHPLGLGLLYVPGRTTLCTQGRIIRHSTRKPLRLIYVGAQENELHHAVRFTLLYLQLAYVVT